MKRIFGIFAAACLLATLAGLSPSHAGNETSTFTDPAEQAFTIQVPKGWQAKGGVVRNSPVDVRSWISVATGDHSTIMFIGDPSIPRFAQRSGAGAMGRPMPIPQGTVEAPYENGQQFAADYGNKVLAHFCTNVQLKGTQPEPAMAQDAATKSLEIARAVGVNIPQPQMDGGSALFTCQANGRPIVARISAVTHIVHIGPIDNWNVAGIRGFTTPAGLEGKAQALLAAMDGSLRWNPDWKQRQIDTTRQQMAQNQQQGAYYSQLLANNARASSQMLYNQYRSTTDMMTANHNAFMQQMNAQRDSRNAAFAQHMYQKAVGQQNEMMYIQNQQCIHRVYNQPGNACNVYVQH
jgi:hypothetical protein